MYLAMCIVPIQVDARLLFAFPIMGYGVVLFEDSYEVLRMSLALVLYAKIVNT